MKYEDFEKFVREKCMYDTIYDDSDGRQILIIQMLDAYGMVDKALRARLAQPEQEPVAWISHNAGLYHGKPDELLNPLPLYTAPPKKEWVGLTDEEYEEMAEQYVTNCYFDTLEYAKNIEAKLKEKNT
jgi:hypothetical protein